MAKGERAVRRAGEGVRSEGPRQAMAGRAHLIFSEMEATGGTEQSFNVI